VNVRVIRQCACALVGVLALCALGPGSALARSVPFGFFGVALDPQIPQYVAPATLDAQMATMASSGVESVRTNFFWPLLEPQQGQYDWAAADGIVHSAAVHGLELLPILEYTPQWASSHPSGPNAQLYAPAHLSTFAAFVTQLVRRYGPRGSFWRGANRRIRDPIRAWQIWNEPMGTWDWRSRPWVNTYAALLAAGYKAIHRADRHAVVVSCALVGARGGLTPAGEATQLYRHGLKRYSDVIAVNAYSGSRSILGSVLQSIKIVQYVRQVMNAHGDARKPIWDTEVSWTAALGKLQPHDYIDIETDPHGQARRLALFFQTVARQRNWGIQRAFWYTWASEYQRTLAFGIPATFQFSGLERWRPGQPFTPLPILATYASTAAQFEGCRKSSNARVCGSG
jgi:polysaccharide biosynthesis protein PslG